MMHRRDFLRGVSTAALTAAWSRSDGAVGSVVMPTAAPSQPSRYISAADHFNLMWRDIYRRKIDVDWFMESAFDRRADVMRAMAKGEISDITASARMLALHSEALRHPPEPREIPPLPANEVGVDEVMALLRRAIAGEVRVVVERRWKDVYHTNGEFSIDGWRIVGFKRNYGIKYVNEAITPDGRRGTHEIWNLREGNPMHLLENDEQDALNELMERLVPS